MNEAELFNLAIGNRQVFGLYNISYGMLSLVIIIIAYLVRFQPMWFRGASAAIAVYFIFNTFMITMASQNAFLGLLTTLSGMAANGEAPLMAQAMTNAGRELGSAWKLAPWQMLGPLAMLGHAGLTIYLFTMAKWGGNDAADNA